ncbi:hypothetical protein K0U07_05295 [bacterium]|nr:hypothetical protein [bacterium]
MDANQSVAAGGGMPPTMEAPAMRPPEVLRVGPIAQRKVIEKLYAVMKKPREQREKGLLELTKYNVLKGWRFDCTNLAKVRGVVFPVFGLIRRSSGMPSFAVIQNIQGTSCVRATFFDDGPQGEKIKKSKDMMPREYVMLVMDIAK